MTRIRLAVVIAAVTVAVLGAAPTSSAGTKPVRDGTIISGVFVTGPWGDCSVTPDCRAWLESDCHPALAGHDPGWLSSIVDVASIADGRTERRFHFGPGEPAGLTIGGAVIQLWTADCREIRDSRWLSWGESIGEDCCWNERTHSFVIPRHARWMTVSGVLDQVNTYWSLR